MKDLKSVVVFVAVAFLLLGALFGMNIMSFIFANLNKANIDSLDNVVVTISNETGGFINITGYTVDAASNSTFLGAVSVITITNATSGEVVLAANYTVTSRGVITNATTQTFSNVNVTYRYTEKSDLRVAVEQSNNGSIQAVVTYTNQSDTQMSTVAIAITLVILIVLFLIFWRSFISPMMKEQGNKNKGNMFG